MSDTAQFTPAVERVVPISAWLAAVVGAFILYIVFQENGLLLQNTWHTMHELFHDGRHTIGVPCH